MTAPPYEHVRQHGAMEWSTPPVDLDEVRRYRLARVREQLRRFDFAGVLLYDQLNSQRGRCPVLPMADSIDIKMSIEASVRRPFRPTSSPPSTRASTER